MEEQKFFTQTKCTYGSCPGYTHGGITDSKMRPWHSECARKALSGYVKVPRTITGILWFIASFLIVLFIRLILRDAQ